METFTRPPMTTAQVARKANVTPRAVLVWVARGKLEPLGRAGDNQKSTFLFDPETVERLLADKEVAA